MDAKVSRRLTRKERNTIEAIEEKASKRQHKPIYTPMWIIEYMFESYKDFSYDEKADALDMLESLFTIGRKCKLMTEKEITRDKKYMMKEYINNWFEDEEEP